MPPVWYIKKMRRTNYLWTRYLMNREGDLQQL